MIRSKAPTSSFEVTKVNPTTYVLKENDAYGEKPLIFVKIHPTAPIILLSDTGCDEPKKEHKHDDITRLRQFLEEYPIDGEPLNAGGKKQYFIICTHCHYDHLNGITQFMPPSQAGPAEVIASSAGRDFFESDLETHGLFKEMGLPVPYFQVTKWAQSFERLTYPFDHPSDDDDHANSTHSSSNSEKKDLGVSIIHTPGHTPDELAWYDHDEMHLYVGDSFYRNAAIIWPKEGNMIDWVFSMAKLRVFVASENQRAMQRLKEVSAEDGEEWANVSKWVLVSCGHETVAEDAMVLLDQVEDFFWRVVREDVKPVWSEEKRGETHDLWLDDGERGLSFFAPRRLMSDARDFFKGSGYGIIAYRAMSR